MRTANEVLEITDRVARNTPFMPQNLYVAKTIAEKAMKVYAEQVLDAFVEGLLKQSFMQEEYNRSSVEMGWLMFKNNIK